MAKKIQLLTHVDAVSGTGHTLSPAQISEARSPSWTSMSRNSVPFVLTLGVLMSAVFANRPLWPTDLWDHVNYGDWMLSHGWFPATEPLLVLAEGVPVVGSAWLSQLGLAAVFASQGYVGLQCVYGLLSVLPLGVVAWGGQRRSGSIIFGFVALFTCLALNWQQMLIIRPQMVGVLFFSVVVTWLLATQTRHRAGWVLLPAMFVVWANSHGSFVMGLMAMTIAGLAQAVTVFSRTKSLLAGITNQRFVRLCLITQLCALAALMNPGGPAAFAEVIRVGGHPNIDSMFEWGPLTLRMRQGQMAGLLGFILVAVLWWSPRRLRLDELMLLVCTWGMTFWSSRMINWLAPVMALSLAAHGAAVWRRIQGKTREHTVIQGTGLWTVVNFSLCCICFAFTPYGVQLLYGRNISHTQTVASQTPVSAAKFLNGLESLPEGLAFCPAEWTGYLQRFGPEKFMPMVNLHVHMIPEEVWNHYQRLSAGSADWQNLVASYGMNLVVTDRSRHERFIQKLRSSEDWVEIFEDIQTIIFERNDPTHQFPVTSKSQDHTVDMSCDDRRTL